MKPKSRITECIGFTKLPDATKAELLRRGLKNRALLRQLLAVEADKHLAMIEEAATKEEVLLDAAGMPLVGEAAEKAKAERAAAKPVKAFEFKMDEKGLSVPSFKWKTTDSTETLVAYADTLRKLLEQIEEKLTSPST